MKLTTDRLILRFFALDDAKTVQKLAGAPEVGATTATIPHPYPDGAAEEWIAQHPKWLEQKRDLTLAMTLPDGDLIGCVSLSGRLKPNGHAELGYWIGVPWWGKGYCTEAARAIVDYGVQEFGLHKITSRHMKSNPASGRVMQKIGMKQEGSLREDYFKNGQWHDIEVYGLLRSEMRIGSHP